ncbi:MAG: dihydroxyacetone kinase subunit DhaL [Paracoccaceae bacterium]
MGQITSADLIAALGAVADSMDENRDALCALDGEIGDGDHGVAMALGFNAARDALADLAGDAVPTIVLNTAAKAFLSGVGASCGPLYATALMRAAASVKGRDVLDASDVPSLLAAMAEGIAHRGKASVGDKTMLDVWQPAADVAGQGWAAVIEAAEAAAEHTKTMPAKLGRAARLGDRTIGHMDPGAASAVLVIKALASRLG